MLYIYIYNTKNTTTRKRVFKLALALASRMFFRRGNRCQPSRIWRLCPLSRPESAIYLKCPGFSRLLLLSWDNRVQTSSTTLELWLESLNHVSFMHSAALSISRYIYSYDQQFCSFVGGALQQNHNFTEHAQEELLIKFSCNGISPRPRRTYQETVFFCP